jgi:hypothetical protein
VQRPREAGGGGLVASDEQGQDLVADLPVAHDRAVLIPRVEQAREQIAVHGARAAAVVDHPLDVLVEDHDRAGERPPALAEEEHGPTDAELCAASELGYATRAPLVQQAELPAHEDVRDGHRPPDDPARPVERHGERVTELVGLRERVCPEQGLSGHRHGDARRLRVERELVAVAPARQRADGAGDHVGGVALERLGVEQRRHELALPPP